VTVGDLVIESEKRNDNKKRFRALKMFSTKQYHNDLNSTTIPAQRSIYGHQTMSMVMHLKGSINQA